MQKDLEGSPSFEVFFWQDCRMLNFDEIVGNARGNCPHPGPPPTVAALLFRGGRHLLRKDFSLTRIASPRAALGGRLEGGRFISCYFFKPAKFGSGGDGLQSTISIGGPSGRSDFCQSIEVSSFAQATSGQSSNMTLTGKLGGVLFNSSGMTASPSACTIERRMPEP